MLMTYKWFQKVLWIAWRAYNKTKEEQKQKDAGLDAASLWLKISNHEKAWVFLLPALSIPLLVKKSQM